MKHILLFTATAILALSATAFADVKIKTRQTVSGQSTENTTYIKGKRQRTEMMGGVMVTVTQCDLGRDLQMNPSTKTYTVNLYDDGSAPTATTNASGSTVPATKGGTMFVTTTIKDTGERKQMFGFTARHIIQTIETETSEDACLQSKTKMEMDMWVIDAEFALACPQERYYRPYKNAKNGGCQDKVVPKTIGSAKSGYPLWQKMTSFDTNGKESFSTVSEVIELSRATLDQSLFDVPADYREVSDSTQLYTTAAASKTSSIDVKSDDPFAANASNSASSRMTASIRNANSNPINVQSDTASSSTAAKKAGSIRIGVSVKTTSVGEGITANDLSAAVQNTIGQYLKGTNVEIVPLEAKLAAAQAGEAKEKECDFVLNVTAAHKKGGGGFGGFGKVFSSVAPMIPMAGGVAGAVASQVVSTAIITATSVSGNVKSKDELSLDFRMSSTTDNRTPLAKQFKTKAKADGDDIISALVEQAAQAIIDTVGK